MEDQTAEPTRLKIDLTVEIDNREMGLEVKPSERPTLKQMLMLPSPRGVLDAGFESENSSLLSGYADSYSLTETLLDRGEEPACCFLRLCRSPSMRRCVTFTAKRDQNSHHWFSFSLLKDHALRRLSTFPASRHSKKLIKHSGSSFRRCILKLNRITPWSSDVVAVYNNAMALSPARNTFWKYFTYEELVLATNDFDTANLIGRGGYADVYRGTLSTGQPIAVKKLCRGSQEDQETSFLTELGVLYHVCHPNTTSLIGFSVEDGLHLVFQLVPHGSLSSFLHGSSGQTLEWSYRYKIAVGIARGLLYLHKHCKRRIIHRDIKASNILLGTDLEPQIIDFGLAKWLPREWTHLSISPVEGTFGYLAPEYFMHGIVDEKTDVFAFGVLLLEIVTGRRPIDASQKSLVKEVTPLLAAGKIAELADSKLQGIYDMNQLCCMVRTAAVCVRHSAIARPCMKEVVRLLTEDEFELESPSYQWKLLLDGPNKLSDEDYQRDMSHYEALLLET